MKKAEKLLLLLAAAAVSLSFSGCTSFETDIEALMQPPSLTEEQAKLNSALTEVIGDNYFLRYPSDGTSNSAFMFYDLDGDNIEEAIAFYSIDGESTRINILKQKNEKWTSIYEAAGAYGDASSVCFAETGPNERSLIVKWEQEVSIYRFENSRLETVYSAFCDGIEMFDMNGDGYEDMVLINSSYSERPFAKIIYSGENGLKATDNVSITAEYDSIVSTTFGKIYDGKIGFFIDSKVYGSDNIYLTEIITLNENSANRSTIANYIAYEQEEEQEGSTVTLVSKLGPRGNYLRNTAAYCEDVDGDGIVEMPVEFREDIASQDNEKFFYVDYMKYNPETEDSESVWFGFVDSENGYKFELPKVFGVGVSINYNFSTGEYSFINNSNGAEVLRLRAVLATEYQDRYEENYVLIGQSGTKVFYACISAQKGDIYYLESETIAQRFSTNKS